MPLDNGSSSSKESKPFFTKEETKKAFDQIDTSSNIMGTSGDIDSYEKAVNYLEAGGTDTGYGNILSIDDLKTTFTGGEPGNQYLRQASTDLANKPKLRADGTEKDDDPVSQKKEVAASTEETEETAEEATAPLSAVETTKADMLAKADTTQAAATATPATTAAAQNKKKGYKSGTVATTPQGISMDDDDSVRPLRGLLADQNKKKALIG